jgi:hypothetical protein
MTFARRRHGAYRLHGEKCWNRRSPQQGTPTRTKQDAPSNFANGFPFASNCFSWNNLRNKTPTRSGVGRELLTKGPFHVCSTWNNPPIGIFHWVIPPILKPVKASASRKKTTFAGNYPPIVHNANRRFPAQPACSPACGCIRCNQYPHPPY